jgi:nucleotide-binding universal stress UspA family protein
MEFAVRIGQATGAQIHILRVVPPNSDIDAQQAALQKAAQPLVGSGNRTHFHITANKSFPDGLMAFLDNANPDLIIVGASHEWRNRTILFGTIPDLVADYAKCSVLMVRRHLLEH